MKRYTVYYYDALKDVNLRDLPENSKVYQLGSKQAWIIEWYDEKGRIFCCLQSYSTITDAYDFRTGEYFGGLKYSRTTSKHQTYFNRYIDDSYPKAWLDLKEVK